MLITRRTLHTVCSCLRHFSVFSRISCQLNEMKRSANGGVMLRHLRYREKLGGQLDPPANIELVVIGSGVNGTPKSFVLNTDHIRLVWILELLSHFINLGVFTLLCMGARED